MKCPICLTDKNTVKTSIEHQVIPSADVYECRSCEFTFVDCSVYSNEDTYKHQVDNSQYFGGNIDRNIEYVKIIKNIKSEESDIIKILEIGTPSNYDLLKRLHEEFEKEVKLYSYDIIENDFPDYINFYTDKTKLLEEGINLLICLHTLEHIPTNQMREFVEFTMAVSKHYLFEVPLCEEDEIIQESTGHPHYTFFSRESILKLYGKDINIETIGKRILRFNNIKNNQYINEY